MAVKVGPSRGLDNAVIYVGHGKVMILTVDPISAIPNFGMRLSARLSVHLIASDYTSSGADPEFATFDYNFPPAMSSSEKEEYVSTVGSECKKLGVAIVGGNTGSYPGASFTVIGTGSMLGRASDSGYVTPAMARKGDAVLITKSAGIEATGSLALSFPEFLEERVGRKVTREAREIIQSCSTVEDARAARQIGLGKDGITSMHDATEGGVLGALDEMAAASRHAFEIDSAKIPVSEQSRRVCAAFGIDPLRTMGEGALLLTCCPDKVHELVRRMSLANISVTAIGEVKQGDGLRLNSKEKHSRRFEPSADRYWAAYGRAIRSGLK